TVNQPPPTLTNFSPTTGGGGTVVTLTGTNFTGATAVTFNGTPATIITVNSATQITVTAPNGATTGLLRVTTPGGTAVSNNAFSVPNIMTAFATGPAGQFPSGLAVG